MSDNPDNATIQALRTRIDEVTNLSKDKDTQLEALNTQLKELTEKVTASERAKLDEVERLKLEASDAQKKVAEMEQYKVDAEKLTTTINGEIEARINALPEERRETIRDLLSTTASPADRLSQLHKLIALGGLDKPVPTGDGIKPGTPPTGGGAPPPGTPPDGTIKYDLKNLPSWSEILQGSK